MHPQTSGPLLIHQEATTALLTLNRPEARNALDESLLGLLRDALEEAATDTTVRAVVVTGAGERAFCAGADIRHMQTMKSEDARRWAQLGHDVFLTIENLPKPVIAAINGLALGGGCELALACDLRVMSDTAQLGQPEIKLGLIPGWGGTQRLFRLAGLTLAKELVMTGRLLGAEEAGRAQLVNRVTTSESLLTAALELAAPFATLPPLAVGYAKRAMYLGQDMELREGIALEVDLFAQVFGTADAAEGLAAFVEKREPRFTGS